MYTPFNSKHFTKHVDPETGAIFSVLTTRVAPIQKGFYFVNSGWSDDGRYLWFYCAYPPSSGNTLAVIDFLTDEIHVFPETRGDDSYMVDGRNGELYWGNEKGVFKRSPHPEDNAVLVAPMPPELKEVGASSCGTHLTFTPNHRELVADIQTRAGSVIGSFDVVTGKFMEWYRTKPGIPYNHAQVNPIDGDLCLCAHEFSRDPVKKEPHPPAFVDGIYPRLQLIARDGGRRMLKPYKNFGGHEFWAPDGKSIYYQNSRYRTFKSREAYGCEVGTLLQDMLDGSPPKVVCEVNIPGGAGVWHAHCSSDQRYFVMDGAYPTGEFPLWRGCETTIHFFNRQTGKLFQFLSKNPVVEGWSIENQGTYHIDPHPRFCLNDSVITFTTTVCGRVDLAVIETEQLKDATK